MKVATKFALAYFATSVIVFSAYAAVLAKRSSALLAQTTTADLQAMGRALRPPAVEVWSREGEARAREVVAAASSSEPDVRVTWSTARDADRDGLESPSDARRAITRGSVVDTLSVGGDGRRVVVYVPLSTESGSDAVLELARAIPGERALMTATLQEELGAAGILALLSSAIALGLGQLLLGGPLSRILKQASRVASGDLSVRLSVKGSTEIASLKRELNRMCDALEEARDRATREAETRIKTLEQLRHADRLRTVGTLASGIAHELGTPLNVIWMRAKQLKVRFSAEQEVASTATIIVEQTERMTKIVRQLLDFSRRREPERSLVDLAEIAQKVVGLLEPFAKKHGVELSTERRDAVFLEADGAQLEQALTNLVVNAVQAIDGAEGSRGHVRVVAEARDDDVSVAVVDDGPGMSSDVQERIFEPFFTTKDVGLGTGLGLAVVHGIVTDHGGAVRVESKVGSGTTITLQFPRS
ncbi:MAG: HAMP domain-containing histidine kinase [Deltaproteobacteria bacterium]|nr:HAMP domain-containing histidine kinase [Deltaproteobacteria bacterium]